MGFYNTSGTGLESIVREDIDEFMRLLQKLYRSYRYREMSMKKYFKVEGIIYIYLKPRGISDRSTLVDELILSFYRVGIKLNQDRNKFSVFLNSDKNLMIFKVESVEIREFLSRRIW